MTKNLTICVLLTIISCGQAQVNENSQSQKISGWETLNASDYSIQYPPDWELDQSGQMGVSFFLFSVLETKEDKFRENVNLVIQDMTGQNIDLDKFTEISESQIKAAITNSNLLESKRINAEISDYQKVVYTGDQGIFHLKFEQHYWLVNGKTYILTLTCENEEFEKFKETGEKILNSFKINK